MMKPIDETWKVDATPPLDTHGVELVFPDREIQFGSIEGPHGENWYSATDVDVARCRLASVAPDFARILLEFVNTKDVCPWCASSGTEAIDDEHKASCSPECEIDLALRKAGLR